MTDIKPWYLSRTIWAGLVSAGATLGAMLGVSLDPGGQAALTEAVLQAISAVSAIVAILGRIQARSRIG